MACTSSTGENMINSTIFGSLCGAGRPVFGQEVREDRAGWMDGQAANLGNRQMAAVLIPGTHLSWCALHCCMKNLAFVQKDTCAHVIICMYVHLEILWSSGHLRQWQKDIYVMCASEMTINALAQVCIMWVEMFYCGSLGIWRIAEKQQRGLRLPQVILPSDLPC